MTTLKAIAASFVRRVGHFLPKNYPQETVFLSDKQKQVYFGYYDVTPFDVSNRRILAMRTALGNSSPHQNGSPLELGYYTLNNPSLFQPFAESLSWNWQQGCRLQWIGNQDGHVIYNSFNNDKYESIVCSIWDGVVHRRYPLPVYAVSQDGRYALSLDFIKLHYGRRGYGYSMPSPDQFDPDVAVYKINLSSGDIETLIRYADIRNLIRNLKEVSDKDYINHLSISPDGSSFIFFYITICGNKRRTHLVQARADGSDLRYKIQEYEPSHYAWKTDGSLLLTVKTSKHSIRYGILSACGKQFNLIEDKALYEDGHPSFLNHECLLSDTYPSKLGHQKLFLYDIKTARRTDMASFYLPPAFAGEKRCDLHPRLSHDKKLVCVDVIKDKRRCMAIIPVGQGIV
jgi:hypothetical protein